MSNEQIAIDDSAIRSALKLRLVQERRSDSEMVIIEELGLCCGQARIDIALVTGQLHGYEIKSDRDSLRRLENQVRIYSQVLDQATLVVGDRFLDVAATTVPAWWGLLHVHAERGELRFCTLRQSGVNPGRDPQVLVKLLWAEHALKLLEQRNAARGVRGKPRRIVWDRVCDCFDVDEIAAAVRAGLKSRVMNRAPS